MKKKKYDPADYSDAPIDDPDNPEWTEEMFRRSKPLSAYPEIYEAVQQAAEELRTRKRGRPKLETPKVQVTLRLDADVVHGFKEDGPGWQGRINQELKKVVKRRSKRPA